MDELGFFTLAAAGALAGAAAWTALIWAAVQDGREARTRDALRRVTS